jgi:hypothetical protein
MTMRNPTIHVRGGAIASIALALVPPAPLAAQKPASDSASVIAPYRAPRLALAEPPLGAGLAQDRPTVVFRYAQGESDDPLDLTSFAVAVDGETRSAQFHADSAEAWGSIEPTGSHASAYAGQPLALGVHQLAARICSLRGVCADVRTTVTVVASVLGSGVAERPAAKLQRWLPVLAMLITLARKLFGF